MQRCVDWQIISINITQANKQLKLCLHLQLLATQREDNHWLVVEDIILMSASLSLRLLLLTLRLNIKYM